MYICKWPRFSLWQALSSMLGDAPRTKHLHNEMTCKVQPSLIMVEFLFRGIFLNLGHVFDKVVTNRTPKQLWKAHHKIKPYPIKSYGWLMVGYEARYDCQPDINLPTDYVNKTWCVSFVCACAFACVRARAREREKVREREEEEKQTKRHECHPDVYMYELLVQFLLELKLTNLN